MTLQKKASTNTYGYVKLIWISRRFIKPTTPKRTPKPTIDETGLIEHENDSVDLFSVCNSFALLLLPKLDSGPSTWLRRRNINDLENIHSK